ncbi:MAG: hypothetical protein GY906_03995 [bacterium]|nr:hypothetical protein [bacterium]
MDYVLEHLASKGILRIRVSGEYRRPNDSCPLMNVMIEAINKMGTDKLLLDMREAKIEGGTEGAHSLGKTPRMEQVGNNSFKIAGVYTVILPETKVLETVLQDGGFVFRAFDDMDNAKDWLKT